MGQAEKVLITEQEYLLFERDSPSKHEYFQGEVFAMSGASFAHNMIFSNTFGSLFNQTKGKKCKPFGSDFRVHIPANSLYTYPDISIVCGDVELTDDKFDTALNPIVIFEILSKSTRNYDKGGKFSLYRQIPTLRDYILIDSEEIMIEKFSKNAEGFWVLSEYKNFNNSFEIDSVQIKMALLDIYESISLKSNGQ